MSLETKENGSNCLVVLNYNDSDRCINVIEYGKKNNIFDYYVLVDNNSENVDKENLHRKIPAYVKLIENSSNIGYGAGHNVGLKYAVEGLRADYVTLIVSDIGYDKTIVEECIDVLKTNADAGVVSCRMKKPNGEEEVSAWEKPTYASYIRWCFPFIRKLFKENQYIYDNQKLKEVDTLRGSFLVFDAKALKNSDYFDENIFMYNEENALSARLKVQGYKLIQITDKYYIHNHINKNINKRSGWKRICKEAESGIYYMHVYRNINGIKLYLLKCCTFLLCLYRYVGRLVKNKI